MCGKDVVKVTYQSPLSLSWNLPPHQVGIADAVSPSYLASRIDSAFARQPSVVAAAEASAARKHSAVKTVSGTSC